ncbi:MAG: deoxyguanosinetriphosphate triphosphohydrolase [Thermomicrobium sp.]|nr:deoxyguanosinetriphosphate triphosphohydrolase [Thermomicrobium sp.]
MSTRSAATIREVLEAREDAWLHPAATRSRGATRSRPEAECPFRTAFQRDRDRVIHSKAFRRLKHKTQVFIAPSGDHFRTRLTHTLEVTQIARTIGRALRLNEDLIEAIGLAHDLGHTPFGHTGERALAAVFPGFRHNEQSLRVVDRLERNGRGLNLTDAVRDGILRHSKTVESISSPVAGWPTTPEGQVVKISDGIAYINHDLDDALRAGIIQLDDVPRDILEALGWSHGERIHRLVADVIATSQPLLDAAEPGAPVVRLSSEMEGIANRLRRFLFERVYEPLNQLESTRKAERIIQFLFEYYVTHPEEIPDDFRAALTGEPAERVAADYVASMTDRYALDRFEAIWIPRFWSFLG